MAQENKRDTSLISSLEDKLLIKIISYLPVKKATATSVLSKRWRNLYHQMKRVVIIDSEFVRDKWDLFVLDISTWVSRLSVEEIEVIEIHIVNPEESVAFINFMVSFAVTKRIKNLVLDFSDPVWERKALDESHHFLFYLPDCIYHQTHIESLKLYACGMNSYKFQNSTALKSFTVGWLLLCDVTTLLSKFPSLESLKFINCACIEDEEVVFGKYQNRLRELVIQDCDFADPNCKLDIPEVVRFKYSGTVPYSFNFERVNKQMQEAYLDVRVEERSGTRTAQVVANLVHSLSSAKTLTVCSFLLQVIQRIEYEDMNNKFETRHLVMKTNLEENEFIGISYMFNKCLDLESLTFELVPPRKIEGLVPVKIDPVEFWFEKMSHKCLERTLKDVKVKAFGGQWNQLCVLHYLMKNGLVLERLTLYLDESKMDMASSGASLLSRTNRALERLWIIVI